MKKINKDYGYGKIFGIGGSDYGRWKWRYGGDIGPIGPIGPDIGQLDRI